MALLTSEYRPPKFLRGSHVETIFPALTRRFRIKYNRSRIPTKDGDFLDLDWSRVGSRRLVIVTHGLEACSKDQYILGMVRAMNRAHFDCVAWNLRGCSGEPNLKIFTYHSGATYDLDEVVMHAIGLGAYREIYLIGFSLGGNLTLKFLGEPWKSVKSIKSAVAFSVPCDLEGCSIRLSQHDSQIYLKRFLRAFRRKVKMKAKQFPGLVNVDGLSKIKNFAEFDERFTAPMFGFKSAQDYWKKSSSLGFLKNIKTPSLLVSAKNDPFLSASCFPEKEVKRHKYLHGEFPEHGGHCGFSMFDSDGLNYAEKRAVRFITEGF
ncbi:MAG: alpha/beta fold hydrolase [Spirochaetia bacterium]|nr:alpha/beta fold hydrolase [Spirochaetia bacterium]